MTKPTPTPWRIVRDFGRTRVVDADGRYVQIVKEHPRIVRAVNSHEALVKALEALFTVTGNETEDGQMSRMATREGRLYFYRQLRPIRDQARAALALARGDDDD